MTSGPIIAIDGPAASGKGTLARGLARIYELPHLDTGLLYRATARAVLAQGGDLDDAGVAAAAAETLQVDGLDESALRGKEMGEAASIVAALPPVRAALVALQRRFALRPGGAVLDGRDIGTVICPEADAKIYVVASVQARAERRFREFGAMGMQVDLAAVLDDIRRRDERDGNRSVAPLVAAADAVLLDTTELDVGAASAAALAIVQRQLAARHRPAKSAGA